MSGLGSLQALLFHDVPELAEVGLRDDVVRLELQRPQVVGLGLLQPAIEVQDGSQVHQRSRVLGPERGRKPIKRPFQVFLRGSQKSSSTYANDSLMSGGILWKQFSNLYKQTKVTRKEKKKVCKQPRCTLCLKNQAAREFSSLCERMGFIWKPSNPVRLYLPEKKKSDTISEGKN